MLNTLKPENESERLQALRRYQILDTPPEPRFDQLVELAAQICGTPMALVTLVDDERVWFKAKIGFEANEVSRQISFCSHGVLETQSLIIPDASQDPRFLANPLVTLAPHIRFYAGIPLLTPEGYNLGAFCVIDQHSRELNEFQHYALNSLAQQAQQLLEQRRTVLELQAQREELKRAQTLNQRLFAILHQELSEPLDELREDLLPPESQRKVEDLYHNLQQLKHWKKLQSDTIQEEASECQLFAMASTLRAKLSPEIAQRHVQLTLNCPPELRANLPAQSLHIILQSLLYHGLKRSEYGELQVSFSALTPQTWQCEVQDQGAPLPGWVQDLIQQPQNTSNPLKHQVLDLDLLLVQGYTQALNGEVEIRQDNNGTVIRIALPFSWQDLDYT